MPRYGTMASAVPRIPAMATRKSSSGFDRNLNTGEDPMTSVRMETARQTVMRSPEYPSHIVLPVIPR